MADAIDYAKFDVFLRIDTWPAPRPLDHERFYQVLDKIVRHPKFNPEEMGEYFRKYHGLDRDAPESDGLNSAVDNYVIRARADRDYLGVTGQV